MALPHHSSLSKIILRNGGLPTLIGLTVILVLGDSAVSQVIQMPDPGSFEEYLKKRMPNLVEPGSRSGPDSITWVGGGNKARATVPVDEVTGLVPPEYPFPRLYEKLPADDPKTLDYERELEKYLENRQRILQIRDEYWRAVGERKRIGLSDAQFDYVASKVVKWNGDICWAPASKERDRIVNAGDEIRAVFGPIPPFDVTKVGKSTRPDGWTIETASLVTEVDGNRVELKPNTSKSGNPLEFEHRDFRGTFVKWTPSIDRCDKPSFASGVTKCSTNSRLSRATRGPVEWIALARKSIDSKDVLSADPYWMSSNSSFDVLGYIGFNRVSGEVAFFDGAHGRKFNWNQAYAPPGGTGYADLQGRNDCSLIYDSKFGNACVGCHDNKEPRIITPNIKQSRVGYRDARIADAFSLKDLLPYLPRGRFAPYRVVGTAFTATSRVALVLDQGRAVIDPSGRCTSCHGLTNGETKRFASDAVGRLGSLTGDNSNENNFRTAWALRTGNGRIHPWMIPGDGNVLSANPSLPVLGDGDWNRLKAVLEKPDSDPQSVKLYTEAPAPEATSTDATRIGDCAGPTNFAIVVADNRDGTSEPLRKEIQFSWRYHNTLGGIPKRDDVRFHLAILESAIPGNAAPSAEADYPTLAQAEGQGASLLAGGVYRDGSLIIVKDVSYTGHVRWTDPAPTTTPRQYSLAFPVASDRRYLIRLVAKRFCFGEPEFKYSTVDHVLSVDVK